MLGSGLYLRGTNIYLAGTDLYLVGTRLYLKRTDLYLIGTRLYLAVIDLYLKGTDLYFDLGTDLYLVLWGKVFGPESWAQDFTSKNEVKIRAWIFGPKTLPHSH